MSWIRLIYFRCCHSLLIGQCYCFNSFVSWTICECSCFKPIVLKQTITNTKIYDNCHRSMLFINLHLVLLLRLELTFLNLKWVIWMLLIDMRPIYMLPKIYFKLIHTNVYTIGTTMIIAQCIIYDTHKCKINKLPWGLYVWHDH